MRRPANRINWSKIERVAIYVTLCAYFLLQIVEALPLPFARKLPSALSSSALGLALVGAIHYLIRVVEDSSRATELGLFRSSFPMAFQEWMRPFDSSRADLRIAAFTSTLFFSQLQASSFTVKRVRLLLLVEDPPEEGADQGVMPYPSCANERFDLENTRRKWMALHSTGQIGELEIRHVRARAALYLGVADSQRVLLGLLWPNPDFVDFKAKEAVVLSLESAPGTVRHLQAWFEEMWNAAEKGIS